MTTEIERLLEKELAIRRKRMALEEVEKDAIHRPKLRALIGQCFKFTNSYGVADECKKWPLYAKIISFDEKNMSFTVCQFQHTTRKHVEIEYEVAYNYNGKSRYGVDTEWEPIMPSEYNRAKRSMLRFVAEVLEH